jgi:hypothetical protein
MGLANGAGPAMRSVGMNANTCDGHFFDRTLTFWYSPFHSEVIYLCLR